MGLYDHTGDLFINGHPAEAFQSKQLHARTTCCFQDHGKYRLTLQENIGIGNINLIDSEVAINEAIGKGLGGAESVRDRVGLGGKLNNTGVPETGGGIERIVQKPNSAKADKRGTASSLRFRGSGKGSSTTDDIAKDTRSSASQRTSLSGGQWQRVALARAFLRAEDADLVVFE
jgi:ABC-type multidrug transport system fused ATPase/permease subunit